MSSPSAIPKQARIDEILGDPKVVDYLRCPPQIEDAYSLSARVTAVAVFSLVAVGITAYILLCTGHLSTFPKDFIHLFTQPVGLGVTTLLIGGTAFVIYRARAQEDPYVNSVIPRSRATDLQAVQLKFDESWKKAYLDASTLKDGNGKAYLYGYKDTGEHYAVTALVTLATPFVVVGAVGFHALRTCIVPFYILVRLAMQVCSGGERRFEAIDVIKEPARSLLHIVKAPFYGLAYMAASLYSLASPMNGRILGAKIERDWNHGATRPEGFWAYFGPQKMWSFSRLDMHFFLAGCWQPVGVATCSFGQVQEAASMRRVLNEKAGYAFEVVTRAGAYTDAQELLKEFNQLMSESND